MDHAGDALDIAYDVLEKMGQGRLSREQMKSLKAARDWARAVRSVGHVFRRDKSIDKDISVLDLDYDVASWYAAMDSQEPLTSYEGQVRYHLSVDWQAVNKIMDSALRMYGDDLSLTVPRVLEYYPISDFWRRTELENTQLLAGE